MANEDANVANDQVVTDTTATDSAPVETNDLEVVSEGPELNPNDIREPQAETDSVETEPESSTDETEAESDTQKNPKEEWESLKGESRERFQQAINERNQLRRQKQELEARLAQFGTEQDLLNEVNPDTGEYYTPQEAERASWQQSREKAQERAQQELYEVQVRENQATINDEVGRVTEEVPILNPQSKEFNQEVFNDYIENLNDSLIYALPDGRQASRTTLLANGINPDTQATLVGSSASPYKLAKLAAKSYSSAKTQEETIGQANAQRATEKMLANVDPPSSNRPANPSAKDVDNMSAEEYAKAHNMKPVW